MRERESRGGGISISPTILGGVATMTFAVVWFVVGLLFFDLLFFYPPILLFLGLIGFVKGMMGHED